MRYSDCYFCCEWKPIVAKGLCRKCYDRDYKRSRRPYRLHMAKKGCQYRECGARVVEGIGRPMCERHHMMFYHREDSPHYTTDCPCLPGHSAEHDVNSKSKCSQPYI